MAKRDFATELAGLPLDCDVGVGQGPPALAVDLLAPRWFAYQHRPELVLLCEWIEKKEIRSYLELGFYRGGLLSALQALFRFEKVAGCDEGLVQKRKGLEVTLPKEARICWAKCESPEYRRFRHAMGHFDLVFIDADHSYGSVRADYEREKKQPHRFLAFHDIKNTTQAPGVVRLWNELGGKKRELYVQRSEAHIRWLESGAQGPEPRSDGDEMGIGIWSQKETP